MLLYSRMGEAKPLPIQAGATLAKPPSRAQVFFLLGFHTESQNILDILLDGLNFRYRHFEGEALTDKRELV